MAKEEKWLDLSHHNTVTSWDDIAKNFDGVILKCTEGNDFVDPKFAEYYAGATKAGLKVQAYHFARFANETDAQLEADFFIKTLAGKALYNDEAVLDIEADDNKLDKATLTGCVMSFSKELSKKADLKTVVYSYPNFLKTELNKFNLPVWLADYSSDGSYTDELSKDYEIVMVQYTSSGKATGVSGNVDLDRRVIAQLSQVTDKPKTEPKPKPKDDGLLKNGDTGSKVKAAQSKLIALGYYKGKVDGIFGPQTEAAVKAFQKAQKIQVDGIIGPDTQKHLDSAKAPKPGGGTYTVKSGDTLSEIGAAHNVDWHDIAELNDIKGPKYVIKVGQKLKLPSGAKQSATKTYTVKKGDTLSGIGVDLEVDWHDIAKLNGIKAPYVIQPGQKLKYKK
ncbi:GH25 family lysozyme M1 (1,4-beta-N-acetylmuramidase) [Pullulanibacillus pueri]|uniref:LysM domain-containing protein n=1 Tax=Pullulanibacillus pueri TaxID=1437324 RepID=A0A8J2ZXE9_9BACL|nr:GH25 family lysozyme [Pullulanibacillus pueri]MBM7681933.1 GH25 family lysozyme M1 (1,4-beta-N-acetylmuramidase) [Pullulanibacillus pueri]GGH83500.1 hypothetical protein GCM10007096_24460 [Pullulanibacillus pueri]